MSDEGIITVEPGKRGGQLCVRGMPRARARPLGARLPRRGERLLGALVHQAGGVYGLPWRFLHGDLPEAPHESRAGHPPRGARLL